MHITVVTLFPEFFSGPLEAGLLGKARAAGLVGLDLVNPRDEALDRHHTVDDRPYGGGPGMVMLPDPLVRTLRKLGHGAPFTPPLPGEPGSAKGPGRILMMAPKGRPLTQELARELAQEERLTILCGRYEGFDARLEELFPIECVSLGDFVLNGGETAALAVIEASCRLLPGFMGHEESGEDESFSHGLLEYPHYTRPEVYENLPVPEILRSGDHGRIAAWRRQESLRATLALRPELLAEAPLSREDLDSMRDMEREKVGRNLFCALVHYPVLDRDKNSVAVSLTNLDIHDIARSSCSYGLGGYYIVTPLEDQRRLLQEILGHWTKGAGAKSNPHRAESLRLVRAAESVDEALARVEERTGQRPLLLATSAREAGTMSFSGARKALAERPALLLFGTGHGLSPHLLEQCDAILPPIRWHGAFNHLSVRSAAAIVMDRILHDWY